jgi:hypothetical protein
VCLSGVYEEEEGGRGRKRREGVEYCGGEWIAEDKVREQGDTGILEREGKEAVVGEEDRGNVRMGSRAGLGEVECGQGREGGQEEEG